VGEPLKRSVMRLIIIMMNSRVVVIGLVLLLANALLPQQSFAQKPSQSQSGCEAIDKTKPHLFISYEATDVQAWNGRKNVKGVLLRLNNNSGCVISLTVPRSYPKEIPPTMGLRDGRVQRLPDVRIGSIKSGTTVEIYYLTKYPSEASLVLTRDFHVIDAIYINNGDSILFSVPIENFKRKGRIVVPFSYDWEAANAALRMEPVEHYLIFRPDQLPVEVLK